MRRLLGGISSTWNSSCGIQRRGTAQLKRVIGVLNPVPGIALLLSDLLMRLPGHRGVIISVSLLAGRSISRCWVTWLFISSTHFFLDLAAQSVDQLADQAAEFANHQHPV
jgi:hypothetical protein